MADAFDIDDDRDITEAKKVDLGNSQFVILPFIVAMPVFKMLNEEATRLGITVANLMTKSLQEKLERLQKEREHGPI